VRSERDRCSRSADAEIPQSALRIWNGCRSWIRTNMSRAEHLNSNARLVPVIVRFSNATGVPHIPDGDPHSNPKGMAIRFNLSGGRITDIVANGQNGFPAGTPADFVDFLGSFLATSPESPKPHAVRPIPGQASQHDAISCHPQSSTG